MGTMGDRVYMNVHPLHDGSRKFYLFTCFATELFTSQSQLSAPDAHLNHSLAPTLQTTKSNKMSYSAPESPGLPENTGSVPNTNAPGPFSERSLPPYPARAMYAAFDPANPQAPTTIPLVNERANSAPSAIETAPFTLRERQPYPDRTMDEITRWMCPPSAPLRGNVSEPITAKKRKAVRASDPPSDWRDWQRENNPRRTAWMGYDNSRHARYGGREILLETASVANEDVVQSIEVESDPLVALRRLASDSQVAIRRELERAIEAEDRVRDLESRLEASIERNRELEMAHQQITRNLTGAQSMLDEARRERVVAQDAAEWLKLRVEEPEEEYNRWQVQQEAYTQARQAEADPLEMNRSLRQSEADMSTRLQAAMANQTVLQAQLDQVENQREQFEMERDHYWTERDREQDRNRQLQAQVQDLSARLEAAQADARNARANQAIAMAAPENPAPEVARQRIIENRAGSARGSGRGAGGRGRRGKAAMTRKQPGRSCKVQKSYR